MLKELQNQIQINSEPELVWKILTDFKKYSQWNPIIFKIIGDLSVGSKIEIHLKTVGGKNRIYHPTITKIVPNHELRWNGKFFFSRLFSGERIFLIEKVSDKKVNFVNKEIFSGMGIKFTPKKMENDILESFKKMNESLKTIVEKQS